MKQPSAPVSTSEPILVLCACPDNNIAKEMAASLVERKLAACVNITGTIQSIYRWEEKIHTDKEVLLLIKTTNKAWELLEQTLLELHPYDVPEIIVMPIVAGSRDYLDWVGDNVCAN
jgi:periplasmic divalent cation tolerance protein